MNAFQRNDLRHVHARAIVIARKQQCRFESTAGQAAHSTAGVDSYRSLLRAWTNPAERCIPSVSLIATRFRAQCVAQCVDRPPRKAG
jgi:hypothetical protein